MAPTNKYGTSLLDWPHYTTLNMSASIEKFRPRRSSLDPPLRVPNHRAARSSKSRRAFAARPTMGQRRHHTAPCRDGFFSRFSVLVLFSCFSKAAMEPPMRTMSNAPSGATRFPSTMARPVGQTMTPSEFNSQKTSSGSVDV